MVVFAVLVARSCSPAEVDVQPSAPSSPPPEAPVRLAEQLGCSSWLDAWAEPVTISRRPPFMLHRGSDGEFDGLRLTGYRRGSPADRIGLRNGDTVYAVNGWPLTSVTSALGAYEGLKRARYFEVELRRRGVDVVLPMRLVDCPAPQTEPNARLADDELTVGALECPGAAAAPSGGIEAESKRGEAPDRGLPSSKP